MPEPSSDEIASRPAAATAARSVEATGSDRDPDPPRVEPPGAWPSWGSVAGPLCLVLVAGVAMPPHQGLLVPILLAAVMIGVGERRLRRLAAARSALRHGAGSPLVRAALCAGALGSVAVLLTVLARGVGGLLVDVPASLWGAAAALAAGLGWALVGTRLPSRARPVVLLALALAIPAAGVAGTRYEAAGPDARGWAHSGPILGIHPFQTTAILVDGHGPFDVPINDYVEPDGGRGYGPQALADALDRALASVAERVYPQGPARIRRALVDAEVEAVTTPAVYERLDREPLEDEQPRFVVRSGSFGRGSRVEFVCPGRRIDPRGPQGESVMNRMCPDKYASEASAGLGVTGRWSGYSEGRGQDRLGLHALRGWTRSDDAQGRRVLERETRWWAWIVLGLVAVTVLLRPARAVGHGLRGVGGALGVVGVVLLVLWNPLALGDLAVGLLPAGPSWAGWPSLAELLVAWTPALALGGLSLYWLEDRGHEDPGLEDPRPGEPSRRAHALVRAHRGGLLAPAVVVVLATLAVAAALPALPWALPSSGEAGLRLLPFVHGVAEAIGERGGLTIFEVEGAVASSLVGLMLGGAVATAAAGVAVRTQLRLRAATGQPEDAAAPWSRAAEAGLALAVLGVAAALVVSRKTAGAAALVPGVIGMTLVLGSGLLRLTRSEIPEGPSAGEGSPLGRALGILGHLGWTALGIALVWAAVAPLPAHPFVTLCTVVGLVAVIGAGLASVAPNTPRPPPDPALERRGEGRL